MEPSVMQETSSPDGKRTSQPSLVSYALIALGVALFVRFFVAAPYVVSGASMEPTFHNWDYLLTDRLSYRIGEPKRGDVVIFRMPDEAGKTLIKRVVGLPGESIFASGGSVRIVNAQHPEGFTLPEPYLFLIP
jgi:signal peptidase I